MHSYTKGLSLIGVMVQSKDKPTGLNIKRQMYGREGFELFSKRVVITSQKSVFTKIDEEANFHAFLTIQWTMEGTHLLLQARTKVLNNDWQGEFRKKYPKFRAVKPLNELTEIELLA